MTSLDSRICWLMPISLSSPQLWSEFPAPPSHHPSNTRSKRQTAPTSFPAAYIPSTTFQVFWRSSHNWIRTHYQGGFVSSLSLGSHSVRWVYLRLKCLFKTSCLEEDEWVWGLHFRRIIKIASYHSEHSFLLKLVSKFDSYYLPCYYPLFIFIISNQITFWI